MAGEAEHDANASDRAWFQDGLHELLAGVLILLYAALFSVSRRNPWTIATAVVALVAWAWLRSRMMDILLRAKRRFVTPRVGPQEPPTWMETDPRTNWITLGLSGRATPARPKRPISGWRGALTVGAATVGSLLALLWLHTPAAYLVAGCAAAAGLLVGAKPVGVPSRLAFFIVLWSLVLWRMGPAPSGNVTLALWLGGIGGCVILAGAASLAGFVWSHPRRRGLAEGG